MPPKPSLAHKGWLYCLFKKFPAVRVIARQLRDQNCLAAILRRVSPCAVKTCAVRPVLARALGELRAAGPSNVQGPVKPNASPGEQSEASRPRWKPGQERHTEPENQDSQQMLKQPSGYRSSKWHYRQRKIILELIMHFIADTDTDENYSGINFL